MNELELREKKISLQEELKELISNGEAEKRELNEDENSKLVSIRSQIDEIENELKKIEKENRELKNKEIKENKKEMKEIRLFDLIKGVSNGTLTDEQREFVTGNKIDYRGTIAAGVAGSGQENVPEEKAPLDLAIRNASVLNKLGCTWFGDAVGDIDTEFWKLSIAVG